MAHLCYTVLMKRDEAISRLRQHEVDLKRLGVEHLYMFGSTARGEAQDDSDVDLFFDYEKGKLGLYELMDVKSRPRQQKSIKAHETHVVNGLTPDFSHGLLELCSTRKLLFLHAEMRNACVHKFFAVSVVSHTGIEL
jgi:predicted nucleotidyltransferase